MKTFKPEHIFTGIIAALLTSFSGMVIIESAQGLGMIESQLFSWMSSIYVVGGLVSLVLTLKYRMPLIGAHSLATAIYLIPVMQGFSINEMVGGYLIAGLLLLVISQLKFLRDFILSIPNYIIEGMLAGIVVNYILNSVLDLSIYILVLVVSVIAYFLVQLYIENIPGFFGGLAVVFITGLFVGFENFEVDQVFFTVEFIVPQIDLVTITVISLPVAVMILSNEVSISLSALKKNGYEVPFQQVVLSSGIGTSIVSLFGGHAAGIGGMSTTICSNEESGAKSERYKSALVAGILIVLFGMLAPLMITLMGAIPAQLISIIVILTLLGILLNCFKSLKNLKSKASIIIMLISFFISAININIYILSAPLLSLIAGTILYSIFIKKAD
ncbi:benzoate/H(+) symporter BenE family transporter [Salinicoccus kekensis]|uniref:Benzoate membrane transport protein n=1 Tax=Salinicoccus kekensis TaxID=714307 RepID=A0A285UAR9_9STAP|nr:benzoate/H(+) symporter BenE family transporter [Salinicoccus kekensis]SOC37656.1 benzoate membrane transport protein [Salinicoccus kekensis]